MEKDKTNGAEIPDTTKPSGMSSVYGALRAAREQRKKIGDAAINKKTTPVQKNFEKKAPKKSFVRTFRDDAARALKKQKASLASLSIAEQKKRLSTTGVDKNFYQTEEPSIKSKIFTILGFIAFLGAAALALFVFFNTSDNPASQQPTPPPPGLISSDFTQRVNISNEQSGELRKKLYALVKQNSNPINTITRILLTGQEVPGNEKIENFLTSENFFGKIFPKSPPSLHRSFEKNFTFGVHVFNGNEPFLIFNTNSFSGVYSGLLAWEKDMMLEVGELFWGESIQDMLSEQVSVNANSTVAQKLKNELISRLNEVRALNTDNPISKERKLNALKEIEDRLKFLVENKENSIMLMVSERGFTDEIIENQDVRILKGKNEEPIILYSLLSHGKVVMTTNQNTLREIILRLSH